MAARAPPGKRRRRWCHPVVWLIGAYVVSRAAFWAAGVRFDLSPPASSWQILDPALLRHDLLVLALYGKNFMITGHFATSDWRGMSLSKLSTRAIDHDTRQRMVNAGALSPDALGDFVFGRPSAYPRIFAATPATGIAVLDQRLKSTGSVNYNHLAYAAIEPWSRAFAALLAMQPAYPEKPASTSKSTRLAGSSCSAMRWPSASACGYW